MTPRPRPRPRACAPAARRGAARAARTSGTPRRARGRDARGRQGRGGARVVEGPLPPAARPVPGRLLPLPRGPVSLVREALADLIVEARRAARSVELRNASRPRARLLYWLCRAARWFLKLAERGAGEPAPPILWSAWTGPWRSFAPPFGCPQGRVDDDAGRRATVRERCPTRSPASTSTAWCGSRAR